MLSEIDPHDIARFGAKTAQLAKVAQIIGITTPRAFGLPFEGYARFLAANGLDRRIATLLADTTLRHDPVRLRTALDELRAAIVAAPVPPALTDAIAARIAVVLRGSPRVRLRSSTNSEDLAGFSGAGLYRSAKIDPASRADLERGLREVWASVWGWEAFAERDWYGIDHAKVAMAILVQESIDDDLVNGVAITGNPYFEGRPAVFINAQVRGGSVTSAAGGEVPEQVLYYTYETGRGLERISESSRAKGQRLVPDGEVKRFADQLEQIHREFVGEAVGSENAVDVEFLIRANRELVIVQARPYRMRWTGQRRTPPR
jgi:rifampicin phosphotransferase